MSQHVNFLKTLPQSPKYLPARWIAYILVATVLTLFGVSLSYMFYQHATSRRLDQVRTDLLKARLRLQKTEAAYPLLAGDKPLVRRLSEMENALRDTQVQYDALAHTVTRLGFSEYLMALATAVPEGLWLTRMYINQNNGNLSLSGYALKPVAVSTLLEGLQRTPVFSKIDFDLFYVKKVKNNNYIRFAIANDELMLPKESDNTSTADERE